MPQKLNVVLVGEMHPWDVMFPFKKAFERLGCNVVTVNQGELYSISIWNRIFKRVLKILSKFKNKWGVRVYFGTKHFNEVVLKKAREVPTDIVVFDNAIFVKPATVTFLQRMGIKVFAWHNHDINDLNNTSRDFYKTIPLCDHHFTTKSYQLDDFRTKGAKGVTFIPFASDTNLYYPEEIHEEEKKKIGADVVFIGSYYEKYRAEILEKLCEEGYDLKVYGNRWHKCRGYKCLKEKALMYRPAEGNDYRRVMNSSKIALGLMSKVISEQHTHRTFEIPACGTFMLHERTKEAMDFFKEGEEAEFFGTFEELTEKIDYYLKNEKERKKIALAGYKKAVSFEHSYLERAQKILDVYLEQENNR